MQHPAVAVLSWHLMPSFPSSAILITMLSKLLYTARPAVRNSRSFMHACLGTVEMHCGT